MAAAPLLAALMARMTAEGRADVTAALDAGAWEGPELSYVLGPDPVRERKLALRAKAEPALTAALADLLGQTERPTVTALDEKARRVPFDDLEFLRDHVADVHWPTSTLDVRRQGRNPALRRARIEVEETPDPAPRKQTGAQGRPALTSMPLIVEEFERRAEEKQCADSIAEEARQLVRWLEENHSDMPAPSPRTVENRVRVAWLAYRAANPTKRPTIL